MKIVAIGGTRPTGSKLVARLRAHRRDWLRLYPPPSAPTVADKPDGPDDLAGRRRRRNAGLVLLRCGVANGGTVGIGHGARRDAPITQGGTALDRRLRVRFLPRVPEARLSRIRA
jgi:hypothetical protein